MRGWGGFAGVLAVVAAVTIAACSDGASPVTPPPSSGAPASTSVTRTSSASVSPLPAPPAAARQPTQAGAEAFVRYFFEVYNYAFATTDGQPIRAISDTACVYCTNIVKGVRQIRDQNAHVVGSEIVTNAVIAAPGDPRTGLLVNVSLVQHPGTTITTDGTVVGTTEGTDHGAVQFAVRWTDQGWRILEGHITGHTGTQE